MALLLGRPVLRENTQDGRAVMLVQQFYPAGLGQEIGAQSRAGKVTSDADIDIFHPKRIQFLQRCQIALQRLGRLGAGDDALAVIGG